MKPWTACATALLAVSPVSSRAAAEPPPVPDLSGYTAVNSEDYETYSGYGTTGVQFAAPGGYRCRMTSTPRASRTNTDCWGSLPGTAYNHAELNSLRPSAEFSTVDLPTMETYEWMDATGMHQETISPTVYKTLPAGGRISFEGQTCGVDAAATTCLAGEHGFVLSPRGSRVF